MREYSKGAFDRQHKAAEKQAEQLHEAMLRKIGKLELENEFLKKLSATEFERVRLIVAEGFVCANGYRLSVTEQCRLLEVKRSNYYH